MWVGGGVLLEIKFYDLALLKAWLRNCNNFVKIKTDSKIFRFCDEREQRIQSLEDIKNNNWFKSVDWDHIRENLTMCWYSSFSLRLFEG